MNLITRLEIIRVRYMTVPLIFGLSDCATFCNDCFYEKSGTYLLNADMLNYKTAEGALRCVLRTGYFTVEDFLKSRLEPIKPTQASIGDLLYFRNSEQLSFPAVVFGTTCVSKGYGGVAVMNTLLATHGYRVPCRSSHP
jgi:hypothetical protein